MQNVYWKIAMVFILICKNFNNETNKYFKIITYKIES